MRRVLVIANPVSGSGRGKRAAVELRAALNARDCEVDLRETEVGRNGTDLAREVTPADYDRLVVIGGDGSVNDVLNGLSDFATPIGVLPAGTANVWAREMRLPKEAARHADLLADGRIVDVALGRAAGRRFFLFVGAGLDARIVHAVEERRAARRGLGGMRQWYAPACKVFFGRPHADLTVTVGDETLRRQGQVIVTRVSHYAASLQLGPGIDASDGLLHVLAFPIRSKLAYLGLGTRSLFGRLRDDRDRRHIATRATIRIDAEVPEPYHIDGTHAGETPVEITLDDRVARFVVPAR